MQSTPEIAAPLLELGFLMGIVLVGHVIAVRRLPAESVPLILRGRIAMCTRMRPWLCTAALVMTATGLFLIFS